MKIFAKLEIESLKAILESGQVTKAYLRKTKSVYGYYQLKPEFNESPFGERVELKPNDFPEETWSTIKGKFNPMVDVYKGEFDLRADQEIDLKWLNKRWKEFLESNDMDFKLLNYHWFLEYLGFHEIFDISVEFGISWEEKEEGFIHYPHKTSYETDRGKCDIEIGWIIPEPESMYKIEIYFER